jgi:polyphosphate kinase
MPGMEFRRVGGYVCLSAMAHTVTMDLDDPTLYVNRELSHLEFQRRVLEQAKDPSVPLLERLRFLTITSTNLDEFFEIRVAGLKEQIAAGIAQLGPDRLSPQDTLRRVGEEAHALVREQYRILDEDLTPALGAEGIRILKRSQWDRAQQKWVRRHFESSVLPVLTPVGLDPAHPFPRLQNKSLNVVVSLEGKDAFGRSSGVAVVQVPRSLPRVVALPREVGQSPHDFILLSSIVRDRVEELFPGMKVLGCWQFRVTRNSELWIDEEEVENLLLALKGELLSRRFGDVVRLEVADDCPDETTQFLLHKFGLDAADLYRVNGPVNLHRLVAVYEQVDRPKLKFPPFVPGTRRRLKHAHDLFEVLKRGDLLLHHPYESFSPVLELVRQAAQDRDVLAIKQTLYRTGSDSPVVGALVDAARTGKEVTAVIELRARFDEADNIDLATRLEEAGANVVYGVVGHKTHAKMMMIVRREARRLRRYVHLATGNYHAKTARVYTDFGLLTCDPTIGEDVHRVFLQLTGMGKAAKTKKLLVSPFSMQAQLLQRIAAEAEEAAAGRPARIQAKLNGLTETEIIQALYRASQAGVPIDLIVRGICRLRPGVKGLSETIRVVSVVGRFLEHSRVFHFHAKGQHLVYASSADWMERNLLHRVETAFPIEDAKLKQRAIQEGIEVHLADNVQAWAMQPDGSYRRARPGKHEPLAAQAELLARLAE